MEFETLLQILITATVQGITEFLPISSSGHLFFINKIFSWEDINLNFMISAHLGTLLAVTIYFRNEVKKYFIQGSIEILKKKKTINTRLLLNLFYSSIPIILFGFFIKFYNINYIYSPWIISCAAIFFSLLLLASDKEKINKNLRDISIKDALVIGIFQIFALIPGSSRAGLCITAARFLGLNRICSAKYSMLLSIPAISGATFLMLINIFNEKSYFLWMEIISVFFLSFFFAYLTISFFIKILKKINFKVFVFYRLIVAFTFLILFYFL